MFFFSLFLTPLISLIVCCLIGVSWVCHLIGKDSNFLETMTCCSCFGPRRRHDVTKNPKLIKGFSDHNSRPDQPSSSSSSGLISLFLFFFHSFMHCIHRNLVESNHKVSSFFFWMDHRVCFTCKGLCFIDQSLSLFVILDDDDSVTCCICDTDS